MDVGYLILLILAVLLVIVAVIMLAIIISGFCFFNKKRRQIGAIYKNLRECFDVRYQFVEKLDSLLKKSDKKILMEAKEKCISAKNADEKVRAEEEFSKALMVAISTVPKSDKDMDKLKSEIQQAEKNMKNLIDSYNKETMIYNEKRNKFPFKFIAKFFKFNEINLLVTSNSNNID